MSSLPSRPINQPWMGGRGYSTFGRGETRRRRGRDPRTSFLEASPRTSKAESHWMLQWIMKSMYWILYLLLLSIIDYFSYFSPCSWSLLWKRVDPSGVTLRLKFGEFSSCDTRLNPKLNPICISFHYSFRFCDLLNLAILIQSRIK